MSIYRTGAGIWVIEGDTHRTKWIEELGTLDIDALIKKVCAFITPGDVVVDVGANIGDHTYFYCRAAGETGVVYAFEPDHEAHACLLLNCGFRDTFFHAAALSRIGTVGLQQHSNRGQNFVLLDQSGIRGFPIDDLAMPRCDLLKIDVEGAEMIVLEGARRTIETMRPIIAIELIDSQLLRFGASKDDVVTWLQEKNYELRPLNEREKMSDDRVDAICLPRERLKSLSSCWHAATRA